MGTRSKENAIVNLLTEDGVFEITGTVKLVPYRKRTFSANKVKQKLTKEQSHEVSSSSFCADKSISAKIPTQKKDINGHHQARDEDLRSIQSTHEPSKKFLKGSQQVNAKELTEIYTRDPSHEAHLSLKEQGSCRSLYSENQSRTSLKQKQNKSHTSQASQKSVQNKEVLTKTYACVNPKCCQCKKPILPKESRGTGVTAAEILRTKTQESLRSKASIHSKVLSDQQSTRSEVDALSIEKNEDFEEPAKPLHEKLSHISFKQNEIYMLPSDPSVPSEFSNRNQEDNEPEKQASRISAAHSKDELLLLAEDLRQESKKSVGVSPSFDEGISTLIHKENYEVHESKSVLSNNYEHYMISPPTPPNDLLAESADLITVQNQNKYQ